MKPLGSQRTYCCNVATLFPRSGHIPARSIHLKKGIHEAFPGLFDVNKRIDDFEIAERGDDRKAFSYEAQVLGRGLKTRLGDPTTF
ncbi:MAG: hypothetical protein GDA67_00155 [Nitrospira sp. CR1.3]|nr:hypothetical protein [Nitrospira sp. CR1.3]